VEQWFSRTVNVAHKEDDALFQRALQNSKSKKQEWNPMIM
jgi:hypothetical protein